MCAGNYMKKLNWFILFLGEMQLAALGRFKQPVLGEVTQSSTTRPLTQHVLVAVKNVWRFLW